MEVPCTNPSEILAAAEAACVSMMVAKELAKEGITPESIETSADIVLAPDGDSWNIPRIHLMVKAHLPQGRQYKVSGSGAAGEEELPDYT
jgi:osmotically inducible protein OsmC